MKKFAFGIAAATVIGLASLVAPAAATTIAPTDSAAQITEFSSQHRHYGAHRGPGFRRGPVCTVRTVVERGRHGRPIVRKVRVCR